MIPAGYIAKRVALKPEFLKTSEVADIYSVSDCVNDNFADYTDHWKHNGFWFFDSPQIIRDLAREIGASLLSTHLFYYEIYGQQFDGKCWSNFLPFEGIPVSVTPPAHKRLEGFDVVTFFAGNAPECSPLSCNSLAEKLRTNTHCLLASFEEARMRLEDGTLLSGEPGPYRIFAVYSVDWP